MKLFDINVAQWTAVVCGVGVLAMVMAFIFSSAFRKDMLTGATGKVSFMGLSLEGVIILVLMALLVLGMAVAVNKDAERDQVSRVASTSAPDAALLLSDLPFDSDSPRDALQIIRSLHDASQTHSESLIRQVADLSPDADESADLRALARRKEGPWRVVQTARKTFITVPDHLKPGEVRGCPEHKDQMLELRSRSSDNEPARHEGRVEVRAGSNVITLAEDCERQFDFIQVGCGVATQLIEPGVLDCMADGKPHWLKYQKKFPVYLVKLSS